MRNARLTALLNKVEREQNAIVITEKEMGWRKKDNPNSKANKILKRKHFLEYAEFDTPKRNFR